MLGGGNFGRKAALHLIFRVRPVARKEKPAFAG
jgi:hypothetical protein